MSLKESEVEFMRVFRGRKGKGEMIRLYYNFNNDYLKLPLFI